MYNSRSMEKGLDKESITKIYGGQSKVYDVLFKKVFRSRIKHAIASMDIHDDDNVLDVGVGTGLSVSFYPKKCSVTGIDISSRMLKQARRKVDKLNLNNLRLMEMDAMNMTFPDDTFDKVFTSHVVSVVPDPYKTISEIKRVCKKGGRIVIINHFRSAHKMMAKVEEMITPLSKKIGWRSDLDLDKFIRQAGLQVEKQYKLKKLDFYHVIFAINNK